MAMVMAAAMAKKNTKLRSWFTFVDSSFASFYRQMKTADEEYELHANVIYRTTLV